MTISVEDLYQMDTQGKPIREASVALTAPADFRPLFDPPIEAFIPRRLSSRLAEVYGVYSEPDQDFWMRGAERFEKDFDAGKPLSEPERDLVAFVRKGTSIPGRLPDPSGPHAYVTDPNDLAKEFADLYSANSEAPWDFWYFAYLTFFGASVADLVTLESSLSVPPRLYTVLIGDSGKTRKSTVMSQTAAFFRDLSHPQACYVDTGSGSAEGLAKHVLQDHPKCLFLQDELQTLVTMASRDGSLMMSMMGTLYQETVYQNNTVKQKIDIQYALMSMIAGCTPETYANMFSRAFVDIGFINRLWLVPGVRSREFPLPPPIPVGPRNTLLAKTRARLDALHKAFVGNSGKPVPRTLTDEARALWDAWYYNQKPETEVGTRLEAYGARLKVLISAVRGYTTVPAIVVADVIKMLDWQFKARIDNEPRPTDSKDAFWEGKIRRIGAKLGPSKKRDIYRKTHGEDTDKDRWYRCFGKVMTQNPATKLWGVRPEDDE